MPRNGSIKDSLKRIFLDQNGDFKDSLLCVMTAFFIAAIVKMLIAYRGSKSFTSASCISKSEKLNNISKLPDGFFERPSGNLIKKIK